VILLLPARRQFVRLDAEVREQNGAHDWASLQSLNIGPGRLIAPV
jgi:hypothetical protein